ncbi:hypothetical protein IFM89_005205 [Coptis chinensis]|uniref:Uncharacterized protein n=1 Tax=Coptis chinensis TaxID=261450 RepID=A0A835HXN5_9MAGN|nr:hypothetical protein IFM89_005205 [Coptis chinensis]
MRAATKVASFGLNNGIRNITSSLPLQEQSIPPTARKASRPIVSSSTDGKPSVLVSEGSSSFSAAKPSCWDDWEFTEDDVLRSDVINPKPRVVFGNVPTFQEAKEATSDLKEALEKEYFSSSGYSETKVCVTSESAISSVPKPVFHAFSLLKESPEAQGVVASLASDKNVWDAVMQNEKVMEYINSHQTSTSSDTATEVNQTFPVNEFYNNLKSSECLNDDSTGKQSEGSGNAFLDFLEKVKITVTDMVSSLSGFLQSIFRGSADENISVDSNGNASAIHVDKTMGASFMALSVLAIMVVVLKRG